jgi:hypothetical protein
MSEEKTLPPIALLREIEASEGVILIPVASLPPGSVITIRIGPEPRQAEAEVAAPPARKSFLNGPR